MSAEIEPYENRVREEDSGTAFDENLAILGNSQSDLDTQQATCVDD